jgi:hypothetical protein
MSKDITFFANIVQCYVENDVITIGFGDHNDAPRNYTIITRFDDDEENYLKGEGPIGIQTNLSIEEYSSAISSVCLNKNTISIKINQNVVDNIGVNKIEIEFDSSAIDVGNLIKYLHLIFDDSHVKLTIL